MAFRKKLYRRIDELQADLYCQDLAPNLKQGAALGIGPGTGGRLLSNAKVAAVAGVAVPAGATRPHQVSISKPG